ncbi:MAG: twin-arginine translocase subunit TatC [Anaerolineae bacterium]|nr:twin-arginine translocase subunit TatC [Anaerolineae bacterium]
MNIPMRRSAAAPVEMSIMEHLVELRNRMFAVLISLVIGTVIGFLAAETVMLYLQQPYGREFIVLGPTSGITAYFRVALMLGGILSIPMITYHLLMFVLPGLTNREKRLVLVSIPPITLLFLVGMLFTWFVLIPPAIGFLSGFQPRLFQPEWTADLYLGFVTTLLFWMGAAFETPLVFFIVALLGFVRPRTLLRNWRIAVVGSMVAAAIITPTVDPVNMFLVVAPLLSLFLLSIGLTAIAARIHDHRAASVAPPPLT